MNNDEKGRKILARMLAPIPFSCWIGDWTSEHGAILRWLHRTPEQEAKGDSDFVGVDNICVDVDAFPVVVVNNETFLICPKKLCAEYGDKVGQIFVDENYEGYYFVPANMMKTNEMVWFMPDTTDNKIAPGAYYSPSRNIAGDLNFVKDFDPFYEITVYSHGAAIHTCYGSYPPVTRNDIVNGRMFDDSGYPTILYRKESNDMHHTYPYDTAAPAEPYCLGFGESSPKSPFRDCRTDAPEENVRIICKGELTIKVKALQLKDSAKQRLSDKLQGFLGNESLFSLLDEKDDVIEAKYICKQ